MRRWFARRASPFLAALTLAAGGCAPAPPPAANTVLEELLGRAAASGEAEADLRALAEGIGPRETGSPAFTAALRWAEARMREAGLSSVALERFSLPAREGREREGRTLVGSLPGRAAAGEIVFLAAHLDTVAGGPGALDDAAGVALVLDVARAFRRLGLSPDRTVRFALFGGEEDGMIGSGAYVRSHAAEIPSFAAVLVLDSGAGPFHAFYSGRNQRFWASVLADMGSAHKAGLLYALHGTWGGNDGLDFLRCGVPVLVPAPSGEGYTAVRHTPADAWGRVDVSGLRQAAGTTAALAWILATRPGPIASWRPPAPALSRLVGDLGPELSRVPARDGFLDLSAGPLPPPLFPTLSPAPTGGPPAPPGAKT